MKQLEELLEMWRKDSELDRTEPGKELTKIPLHHSKYLNILSASSTSYSKFKLIKRDKWEYYTGKLDDEDLSKHGWEPFPYVLKSEITTYLDSDEDINKYKASKAIHEEIVTVCEAILKELHSRTFQLKSFIDWEKFIQGS